MRVKTASLVKNWLS